MAVQNEPEIILYDVACTKNVCFSPVVWRIRLMLNYKRIPYNTVFVEFPDVEPTLKALGIVPGEYALDPEIKYTVPAIRHVPTNKYIMDSIPIAEFIEATYPDPPLPLVTEYGSELQKKLQEKISPAFRTSAMAREINILSPRAKEYYRSTREPSLGHRLEDLLLKEEDVWSQTDSDIRAMGEMMQKNKADGPFVLGAQVSAVDFFIVGTLQCGRVIDEGIFQRFMKYPGYGDIYEACLPYMTKRD